MKRNARFTINPIISKIQNIANQNNENLCFLNGKYSIKINNYFLVNNRIIFYIFVK